MINHITAMDLFKYILISIPLISSMTCGIIFMVVFHKSLSVTENKIRQTLGSYFILMTLLWLIMNISVEHYEGKFLLIPFFFLLIHLTQVVFYHFICYIIPTKDKFNTFHYKIAIAIFIMSSILVYLLFTFEGHQALNLHDFFYQYLYIYTSLNMVYYTALCWIRLYKQNREKNKLEFGKNQLNWIFILLVLRTLFSVLFIFNNQRILLVDISIVVLIATQHIIVIFNMLQQNIMDRIRAEYKTNIMLPSGQIVSVDNKGLVEHVATTTAYLQQDAEPNSLLTQHDIVTYFSTEKPYLNKDFKLEDLVKHFGVNRTYISKFINVTFHTNVSQYINHWRIKEVEELQKIHENTLLEDLVQQVGFSNLRHYMRAKQNVGQKNKTN